MDCNRSNRELNSFHVRNIEIPFKSLIRYNSKGTVNVNWTRPSLNGG